MISPLQTLQRKIDYVFKDTELLEMALRHRSSGESHHNERLEFLGDSLLSVIIASELFHRFPEAQEGQLSRLRSYLVKEDTLATMAKRFDVGLYIEMGFGEAKSGGRERPSILADCLEALIGAIYLDSDIACCYKTVAKWYQPNIKDISLSNIHKDPKSSLQELLQSRKMPLPTYRLVKTIGADHDQQFVMEGHAALLDHPVQATGHTRRKAEQAVAARILGELGYDE